ncbi:unnamed protein product (macronuclear) [Paramecium tetraurelia]|uniref:Vacuolar protein sorting-associated protein 26 n=1 Tax=Paramecium tetraurelia TaxID=5888 RepID=A0DVB7_PARTE|nr:uncharacterized protein GSPATT00020648001 [Paramecium tetraurelia]CAK86984.1 unnamed protein product [Paramecium tetraurelia]|eukprot:XP_001454381.1 hypothetical protein (macronuclear) [Paramecium tetraurelia strain d4-2]
MVCQGVEEVDFAVLILEPQEDQPQTTNMEVGIEDILHINFEYSKNRFHQKDVLTGILNMCLVEIKIKYVQLVITRKEYYLQGSQFETDNKTIVKYELVDGCPQKGDMIPVRLYLSELDLIPSVRNVYDKFCVKNLMSLFIIDEDDKRYFQSQVITIYRKK